MILILALFSYKNDTYFAGYCIFYNTVFGQGWSILCLQELFRLQKSKTEFTFVLKISLLFSLCYFYYFHADFKYVLMHKLQTF